jgi:hypothetical protein
MLTQWVAAVSTSVMLVAASDVLAQTPPAKGAGQAAKPAMSDDALVKLATSAAPSDIGAKATVVDHSEGGKTRTVRQGSNNWVCMAHPEIMCLDKNWQQWADAWINKRTPKVSGMGIAYMLQGDTGASNTDPYATGPSPSNDWVVTPAHIMVLTSDPKLLESLPTDPYSGGPWVMWKGTPYAHIMVPTAPMPPRAGAK